MQLSITKISPIFQPQPQNFSWKKFPIFFLKKKNHSEKMLDISGNGTFKSQGLKNKNI